MSKPAARASVVVPLSGGPGQALRCLQGLAAQGDEPQFEVIVVDDASTGLRHLLDQLAGDVQVLHNDRRLGLAGSLELALPRITAPVVVLLRGGAVPAVGWLRSLIGALEDPALATALSASDWDPRTPALSAWSAAMRTEQLRSMAMPPVPDELLLGTLALQLSCHGRAEVVAEGSVTPPARDTVLAPGSPSELTIVIPTLDATSERVRDCLRAIAATTDVAHEVVMVDNGAPPQGFSGPVNAGIRAARTPYVVVMNDDVEPQAGWFEPLRDALDAGAAVAFPLTVDGAMRTDFAAWCFAIGREAIDTFSHAPGEFFDPALVIWFQDLDLLVRLQRAGRPPVLVRESTIRHGLSQTLASSEPRLAQWIEHQVESDRQRFEAKHPEVRLHPHVLAG